MPELELIPDTEPERQYYYLKLAKNLVSDLSANRGKTLTYHVTTFGCQMNARDSEKLTGILKEIGFAYEEDEELADFVIFNTCTVRDNANQRVYGRLGVLGGKKKKNPDHLIALCGCMMQEKEAVEKIKKSYSFVDLIFGTHNIYKFAELICKRLESGKRVIDVWEKEGGIVEDIPLSLIHI